IRIARSFLGEHADLFRANPDRFGEPSAVYAMNRWAVLFPEVYRGVPVLGGRAHALFTREGRIYAAGSDFHPDLAVSVIPSIARDEAVALAGFDLGYVEGRDGAREASLWIYPVRGEDRFDYRLSWRVRTEMQDPLGNWESWVDAGSGEIFGRKNLYEFVDVTGTVASTVDDPNPCSPSQTVPVKGGNVQIVGGGTTATEEDGSFFISHTGSDSVDVWTRFYGPSFNVDNFAGDDSQDTVRALPGSPVGLHWDDSNSHVAERDGWQHANTVRDFIKALDPAFTSMDYRMRVRVNRTDGYCPGNAWWDGRDMNFCATGASYSNTATLGDVVYHEYGHGVTQNVYGGYSYDGAVSEGNSDILPLLILRNSMLGTNFYNGICHMGIRTANHSMIYPDDLTGQGHHDGQLISGFFWEARANLITTHGVEVADSIAQHLWHFSRKSGRPSNMQDQVTWTFLYDDDDGNLDNGTPNFADLASAAAQRGFEAPVVSEGVQITHAGIPSTTDTVSSRTAVATVEGLSAGIDPSSIKLWWRTSGGGFSEIPMAPSGTPGDYEAEIPPFSRNSRVEYYIEAADSASHVGRSPTNAPVALHRYDVVYLYDPCEEVGGWTIGDSTDEATGGVWINAEPVGNETRPEHDATPGSGENCFVTGNTGNVNGGKTTLYSPVYPLYGREEVVARYARWFSNDFEAVGPLVGRDDYWNVHVSNDGGETWVSVEETNEGTESWVEIEVRIDSLFAYANLVRFRFTADDSGSATRVHAAVDEFRVLASPEISTAVAEGGSGGAPLAFSLGENRPNPFNPLTTFSYTIPAKSRVSLDIFSVSGRLVRSLVDGVQEAGGYQAAWDGTDRFGRPVASGVYFYRLKSGGLTESRRMILVR
ncbi:MAG: FlgD immunoglobulin-like domain containing protein, partial [Candidatus Eisenbacteria bacterium]